MPLAFIYLLFVIFSITPVNASPAAPETMAQLRSALRAGSIIDLQSMIENNQAQRLQSLDLMARYCAQNYREQPEFVANVLGLITQYSSTLTPTNSSYIAASLASLHNTMSASGALACVNADAKPGNDNAQAASYRSMMQSMEQLAGQPAIIANSPELFAKINADNNKCDSAADDKDTAQLVQLPNSGRPTLPNVSSSALGVPGGLSNPAGSFVPPSIPPDDHNASPN
jgi:hypothetical protein